NAELASGTPNQDRVKQLVNERQDNQLKLQQVNRDEAREMQGYLTPVQHARYQEERRRFQERVAEVVRHRRAARQQMPGERPSTGCLGNVRLSPAGMTATLRVTSASCGPPTGLSLLRKMIRADRPAMVTPLVKLMKGPGLFSQPSTVNVATAEAVVTAA